MGDEVLMVFAWDALRQLADRSFGLPSDDRERMELARSEGMGLPSPWKMLEEARSLGARVVACESVAKMCGFAPGELDGAVDEVMGLASIWRLTEGARTVSL
jgi:peroxiredoxin family protein